MKEFFREKLNAIIALVVIIIAFLVSLAIMLRYKNEGEKSMPINISKLVIVSSAEASEKNDDNNEKKWNFNVNQYNDIYISFKKNDDVKKNAYIDNITIENIEFTKSKNSNIEIYRPTGNEKKMFLYENEYKVGESLEFNGAVSDNMKNLEIANSGGTLMFRVLNKNVGEYVSDEDDEIHYDGTLLKKAGINLEDLKTKMKFDVVIETNRSTYRGNVEIEIPNENTEEEGVTQKTIDNFDNVVFKRERKK